MSSRPYALALLLAVAAAGPMACGAPTDPEQLTRDGVAALNAGDYGTAYSHLHRATKALPADSPRALEARVCLCRALVHRDPELCVEALAKLSGERDDLEAADVEVVVHELMEARAFTEAAAVIAIGLERFPDSERLADLLQTSGDVMTRAEVPEAVRALQSLGYAGGKDQ